MPSRDILFEILLQFNGAMENHCILSMVIYMGAKRKKAKETYRCCCFNSNCTNASRTPTIHVQTLFNNMQSACVDANILHYIM